MKKFSIIIPTMYKLPYIMDTLKDLVDIDCVDEIIVIENDECAFEKVKHEKIVYVKVFSNIYCNPAWNMGARMAKNEYICLLSDDILFDFNFIFGNLKESELMDNIGILGLSENCYHEIENNDNTQIVGSMTRGYGFGSCMFMKKENYFHIPEDLKINFGDEWLYRKQKKPNCEISMLSTNQAVSKTVSHPSLKDTIDNDYQFWKNKYSFMI